MAEYYNYNVIDESGQINLNPTGYTTVVSDRSKAMNRNAIYEFQKQLVPFLNSGERLISQFNSGDIYREYKTDSPSIRNSDFYPFLDTYIKTFYGIGAGYPLFVFRLAWSEEAATNDPDAVIKDKTISGSYDYNYEELFEGLRNADEKLDFYIADKSEPHWPPRYTDKVIKDLTGISTFTLHPQGYVDRTFNAGLRRFVFINLSKTKEYWLNLGYGNTTLTTHYNFCYDTKCYNSLLFDLYEPACVKFSISDLLSKQNPLSSINYKYSCLSYTFGAYMAEFEYKDMYMLQNEDPHSSELSYLYNTSSGNKYNMGYPPQNPYDEAHIDTYTKYNDAKFTIASSDDTEIYDGLNVVLYGYDYAIARHKTFGVKKCVSGTELLSTSSNKDFTIKKKYVFPSGKLFSDDVIKRYTFFMLTKNKGDAKCNDNLWVSHRSPKKDYSLELSKDGDFSMSTWLYLDNRIDTVSD